MYVGQTYIFNYFLIAEKLDLSLIPAKEKTSDCEMAFASVKGKCRLLCSSIICVTQYIRTEILFSFTYNLLILLTCSACISMPVFSFTNGRKRKTPGIKQMGTETRAGYQMLSHQFLVFF